MLRDATREAHARVDAQFAAGIHTYAAYAAYLVGMHAVVVALDVALHELPLSPAWRAWQLSERVTWLRHDLDALSLPMLQPMPFALTDAHAAADAAAAGALYVIEGSALGARLLLADVRMLATQRPLAAQFLEHHSGAGGDRRWPRFVAALDNIDIGEPGINAAMLAAARAAFVLTDTCLDLARRRLAHLLPDAST